MTAGCVVCGELGVKNDNYSKAVNGNNKLYSYCECARCGGFHYDPQLLFTEANELQDSKKASLSRLIRCYKPKKGISGFEISEDVLKGLSPIYPYEQAENLIDYLGNKEPVPGSYLRLNEANIRMEIVALCGLSIRDSLRNLTFIIDSLKQDNLLDENSRFTGDNGKICLTMSGWHKYEEINRQKTESKRGFMAMKFPETGVTEELERTYAAFQNEINNNTNLKLYNPCLEYPEAGSIDNRVAVEIRKSLFVVADLTHGNNGAYWEAGFAHGLGKPVFYTCNENYRNSTHFDINHHTTIFWNPADVETAAQKLRYAIENTIPEAIL